MQQRIKNVMAAVFNVDSDSIGSGFTPETVEMWDSLRHMNLVIALEQEFGVEFDENDIPAMLSMPSIAAIIATKTQA